MNPNVVDESVLIERREVVDGLIAEINLQKDKRVDRSKRFSFGEIFFLVLCSQVCGYETFREYEAYGKLKIDLLKKFLPYKKGSPSRSTIARVLAIFDPKKLDHLFLEWMQKITKNNEYHVAEKTQKNIVLDGKTHRGAQDENLHLVSAFDTNSGLILGEEKVAHKSNEITAIPALLDLIMIQGHIVSIDAMGCQKSIAEKICSKGADYLLALKKNHANFYEEVETYFQDPDLLKTCNSAIRTDKGHGRVETRTCYVTQNIDWLTEKSSWKNLKSLVMVVSKRWISGKETIEQRFFITSLEADPVKILAATRAHWGIENSLHWVLDVIFGEDSRIIWDHNIAHNESIIRRLALNLLKQYRLTLPTKSAKSEKIAIKTLRKIMIIDDEKMLSLLNKAF
jgi:predicted transposase YbfD/YdcC